MFVFKTSVSLNDLRQFRPGKTEFAATPPESIAYPVIECYPGSSQPMSLV